MINKKKILYLTQKAILTGTLSITLFSGTPINAYSKDINSKYINYYEYEEDDDKKVINVPEKYKEVIKKAINKINSDDITVGDLKILNPTYYFSIKVDDDNDDLSWLNYCKNLNTLTISFNNCNSTKMLKNIKELPNLKWLLLFNNGKILDFTDDEDFNFIKESKHIELLDISGFNIEPGVLENMTNLKRISLGKGNNMNIDYSKLTFLNSLEITDKPYTAASYITNFEIDTLEKNHVSISSITSSDFLEKLKQINLELDNIVKSLEIKENDSDQEKLNKILIYVLENCTYDQDIKNNNYTADYISSFYEEGKLYGALEKNTQICGNYSALVCALCKRVDLNANYICDNKHAWNLIEINGQNYYVDSTWLDDEYFISQTKIQDPEGNTYDYIYKKISTLDLLKNRDIDNLKTTWYMVDPFNFYNIDTNNIHQTDKIPSYIKISPIFKENNSQIDVDKYIIEIKNDNKKYIFEIGAAILIGVILGIYTGYLIKNTIKTKPIEKIKKLSKDSFNNK